MGANAIPIIVVTAFWGIVGGILPWFVAKGPNRGVTQTVLVITACSCWLLSGLPYLTNIHFLGLDKFTVYFFVYQSPILFYIDMKISWLCAYMMQMNPLIGPQLSSHSMLIMKRYWGKADE